MSMDEKGKKMEELKRCPFCGGEVAIAETGTDARKWMFITRANGKTNALAVLLWKVGSIGLIAPKRIKKELKLTLSKHGTNATKRIEHGQKTRQLYIPTILL